MYWYCREKSDVNHSWDFRVNLPAQVFCYVNEVSFWCKYQTSLRVQSVLFNWPFPSSLLPLFQNESKCETFHMKMSFTYKSIRMQIILIFIWKISHLDSVWNRGRRQLGNGLLALIWWATIQNPSFIFVKCSEKPAEIPRKNTAYLFTLGFLPNSKVSNSSWCHIL